MNPETFKLLQQQDWDPILRELVGFAVFRARNYPWRRGGSWELAAGETVEDIVQKAVVKTIEGRRNWDPHKGPLVPWLRDQVKSEIDHLYHSRPHKYEVTTPRGEDGEELTDVVVDHASQQDAFGATFVQDPEQIILKEEEIQRRADVLFQAVDGDPGLEEVLNAVFNCGAKPQHLAAEIGVPVEDIYNRLKRLRRRVIKLSRGENP